MSNFRTLFSSTNFNLIYSFTCPLGLSYNFDKDLAIGHLTTIKILIQVVTYRLSWISRKNSHGSLKLKFSATFRKELQRQKEELCKTKDTVVYNDSDTFRDKSFSVIGFWMGLSVISLLLMCDICCRLRTKRKQLDSIVEPRLHCFYCVELNNTVICPIHNATWISELHFKLIKSGTWCEERVTDLPAEICTFFNGHRSTAFILSRAPWASPQKSPNFVN